MVTVALVMVNEAVQVADAANHRAHVDGTDGQCTLAQLLRLALAHNGHVVQGHGVAQRALPWFLGNSHCCDHEPQYQHRQ